MKLRCSLRTSFAAGGSALLSVGFIAGVAPIASRAQQPPAPAIPSGAATPAASGAKPSTPAPDRTLTLTYSRPGTYDYWTVGKSGPGAVLTATPGAKSIPISIPADTVALEVLDPNTGCVATLDAKHIGGATATVTPNDFDRLRTVKVTISAANGRPVEKAQVTLKDAGGASTAKVLTADDGGVATFNDVPLGKATVGAAAGVGGSRTSSDVVLSPAKGGGPTAVPLTLTGDVPTIAATPSGGASPGMPVAPASEHPSEAVTPPGPAGNSWVAGIFGVCLLGIGMYYGLRMAKNRGVTVEGALKKIGVETPANAVAPAHAGLKPAPAPLPPLPSLTELPPAGAAPGAAAAFAAAGATVAKGTPRLIGLAGPVSGEVFDLDPAEPFTIGRDIANGLSLAQDTAVSRRHARFARGSGGWEMVDEGSSNGSYLNGVRVASATKPLRSGDEIQIGDSRFRFEGG